MPKPLLRWVMGGGATKDGFDVLDHAVDQARKLYPECDYAVLYNNLNDKEMKRIEKIGVELIEQTQYNVEGIAPPIKAEHLMWPPRVRIETHELQMDNDIVLLRRHAYIDEFLHEDDLFIATESYIPQNYGLYSDAVPTRRGKGINSGLYGMPPGFDFGKWLFEFYEKYDRRPYHHLNPQGIVAAMIKDQAKFKIMAKSDIIIVPTMRKWRMDMLVRKVVGLHFTGINRSMCIDQWAIYRTIMKV
jgi:hypothetical protein